jgi:hypothetical protein
MDTGLAISMPTTKVLEILCLNLYVHATCTYPLAFCSYLLITDQVEHNQPGQIQVMLLSTSSVLLIIFMIARSSRLVFIFYASSIYLHN